MSESNSGFTIHPLTTAQISGLAMAQLTSAQLGGLVASQLQNPPDPIPRPDITPPNIITQGSNLSGFHRLLLVVAPSLEVFQEFVQINGGPQVDVDETVLANRYMRYLPVSEETYAKVVDFNPVGMSRDLLVIGYPSRYSDDKLFIRIAKCFGFGTHGDLRCYDPEFVGLEDVR